MSQLKMYRLPGTPIDEYPLPEGYSFSHFDPGKDIHAWCECLRPGLIEGVDDMTAYKNEIIDFKDVVPEQDIWFLDHNGKHVGTVTGFVHKATNTGDMHMVGIRPDYRGKGLSKYLSYICLKSLSERNVKYISLTTGEGRKAAVKSYLSAGFLPVEYDYLMQKRWEAVLREHHINSVQMLYEDGTPYRIIYADKKDPAVKFGVLGAGRGKAMMNFCAGSEDAELVAVCDHSEKKLSEAKEKYGNDSISYYTDFDEFLKHDMDFVVLANYANEHAPFAIKCLRAGKHVLSEVLPAQNMKEAVELIETVEQTGKIYSYAENCCYMPAPKKMLRLKLTDRLGVFEYGEGEYMHNCEPIWPQIIGGDKDHWRNTMSAFYYCTHSIGPLIHISGLRPVKVIGLEAPFNEKMRRMGAKAGPYGVEMITLENGAILKSIHGVGPSKSSLWYSIYGSKGRIESAREDTNLGGTGTIYMSLDNVEGSNDGGFCDTNCEDGLSELAEGTGHGGADFYVMYNMVQKVKGNDSVDIISVYEAMDMFLPGLFAYRSVIRGGIPMDIPDLRDPAEREKWRNDTECTDAACAGEMLVPSYSKGDPYK